MFKGLVYQCMQSYKNAHHCRCLLPKQDMVTDGKRQLARVQGLSPSFPRPFLGTRFFEPQHISICSFPSSEATKAPFQVFSLMNCREVWDAVMKCT